MNEETTQNEYNQLNTNNSKQLSIKQLKLLTEKAKEARQKKYEEESKKRLFEIARKKMQTCFIGDIHTCEEILGFLWGHGVSDENLTEQQQEFRQLWNQARNRMLTNGNNQIRAFQQELEKNTINWDRHRMVVRCQIEESAPDTFQVNKEKKNEQ